MWWVLSLQQGSKILKGKTGHSSASVLLPSAQAGTNPMAALKKKNCLTSAEYTDAAGTLRTWNLDLVKANEEDSSSLKKRATREADTLRQHPGISTHLKISTVLHI